MPDIRPLHRDDLPQVGALIAREYGPVLPAGGEAAWLSDHLCDQPWADPEVPSLVAAESDGAIIGFMGAHARRVRLGERELRAAVCSHLVVDAERRSTAAGAMLVSRFMSGAQDLSYSDTAIEVVARMWRAAGGTIDPVRSLAWMRVLRPGAWLARVAGGRFGADGVDTGLTPFRPLPIDRGMLRGSVEGLAEEPLTPAVMMEHAEALLSPLTLRLGYTECWLDWLFGRLEHDQRPSRVVSRLVRRRGRPIGWYVYVRRPSGAGEVLQIAGRARDIGAVLASLLAGAKADGAVAMTGRVEPHLADALRAHKCAVGFGSRSVVHTSDPGVREALAAPDSLLSRLDGEWWAGAAPAAAP
jgi:hypothetical protein